MAIRAHSDRRLSHRRFLPVLPPQRDRLDVARSTRMPGRCVPSASRPRSRRLPADATHVIGKEHFRPLKQNGYGKFALLTLGGTSWQANVFEKQCAGCHTTAVNPQTGEFSSIALDCYSCHGNVPEDHATQKGTALLSRTRPNADKEVISICGSCHLRGGRSKTSGRPYPHAYVAGDDLFKDFRGRPEARQQGADRQQRLARVPEDARGPGRRLGQELRGLSSHPRPAGARNRRRQALQRDLSLLSQRCSAPAPAHSRIHAQQALARPFTRPSPTSRDCAADRCCDPSPARRDTRAAATECSAAARRAPARTSAPR